jgi:hypothetical protein
MHSDSSRSPRWSGCRRVRCVTPADQERDHTRGSGVAGDLPPQCRAVGGATVAVDHIAGIETRGTSLVNCEVDVVTGDGPADEPAPDDSVDSVRARPGWLGLGGIRRDDFQVRGRPERQQLVVGALTHVLATALRADSEPGLDLADTVLEFGDSEDEVVDAHHGLRR